MLRARDFVCFIPEEHSPALSKLDYRALYNKISQPKLGQIVHVGGVLKLLEQADFKTDPGFDNCPRFVGVIEQNKI